jgi:hypothetical protein
MRKASMKQAEWISRQLGDDYKETADDVYDVLLGNITQPADFVSDVKQLALDYDEELRRHNGR